MKALNLYGVQDVRYEDVRKPEIEKENDVLIKVNTAGICGSDISRFGKIGSYNPGLTWGHEFSGIVESTGRGVTSVSKGDRVTACNFSITTYYPPEPPLKHLLNPFRKN
ncbi:alcohol dehydrogenase catalytic domain-containing protein [Salmonella enterica]|uniref:alcohol dehydrogenase catalytic domain-containing protein n=1 Tax=Salmonella enterica TaxID=28901 RepID=UPI0030BE6AFD